MSEPQVFIWGVPRVDYMSVVRDRAKSPEFKGRLGKDQSLIEFSVQMGGCVLLEQILRTMVSSDVKIATNIDWQESGGNKSQGALLELFGNPRKPNATINWTRWRKIKGDGWATPSESEDSINNRIDGPSGYEIGSGLNRDLLLNENYVRQLRDADHLNKRLLMFVDRGWNYDEPVSALTVGDGCEHIITSLEATGELENSVAYRLFRGCADKVTFVTTLSDLRRLNKVSLGLPLSWERTVQDVVAAVDSLFGTDQSPAYRRVIVMVELCGAIIIEFGEGRKVENTVLIFDQSRQEGDFPRKYPGRVIGYTVTLLAAIAGTLITFDTSPKEKLWELAVRCGLSCQRFLHKNGFELKDGPLPDERPLLFPFDKVSDHFLGCAYRAQAPIMLNTIERSRLTNQIEDLVAIGMQEKVDKLKPELTRLNTVLADLDADPYGFNYTENTASLNDDFKPEWCSGSVPNSLDDDLMSFNYKLYGSTPDLWTILHQNENGLNNIKRRQRIYKVANDIVKTGRKALKNIPIEQIGDWSSADRQEIEGVRAVSNAIRNYMESPGDKPLSIAVFGPPGSGKSFVVKQIAQSQGFDKDAIQEFNLSQYESAHELARAFHVVRDLTLRKKLPLIFWDEFDTPPPFGGTLGWLRHFLAPMQDGSFSELGVTHPVGPGIYVFAGGTYSNYSSFVSAKVDPQIKKDDFVSRLSAYINVKGPNGEPNTLEDPLLPIRRAFLLRSQILKEAKQVSMLRAGEPEPEIAITDSVLAAFIRTAVYRHGARSLENIIKRSKLDDKVAFDASSLPPEPILSMHVDARNYSDYATCACKGRFRIGVRWDEAEGITQIEEFKTRAASLLEITNRHPFTAGNSESICNALTIVVPIADMSEVDPCQAIIEAMMTAGTNERGIMPRVMIVLPVARDEFIRQNSQRNPVCKYKLNSVLDAAHEVIVLPSVRDLARPARHEGRLFETTRSSKRLDRYVLFYSDDCIQVSKQTL